MFRCASLARDGNINASVSYGSNTNTNMGYLKIGFFEFERTYCTLCYAMLNQTWKPFNVPKMKSMMRCLRVLGRIARHSPLHRSKRTLLGLDKSRVPRLPILILDRVNIGAHQDRVTVDIAVKAFRRESHDVCTAPVVLAFQSGYPVCCYSRLHSCCGRGRRNQYLDLDSHFVS